VTGFFLVRLPNKHAALFFLIGLPPVFLSPQGFVLLSVHGDKILRTSKTTMQIQAEVSLSIPLLRVQCNPLYCEPICTYVYKDQLSILVYRP